MDLTLTQEDMGASSTNIKIEGRGQHNGADFTFTGPFELVKLQYAQGTKYNHDHKYNAIVFEQKEFILNINAGDLTVEGADLDAEAKELLVKDIKFGLTEYKDALIDARQDLIKSFPMDLAVPYVFMFYSAQFASNVEFSEKFVQMDFSLEHFGLLKKNQLRLLKTIESTFDRETNERDEEALIQLYLDDNLFNSFSAVFTTVDKMFSLRDIFKTYPNAVQFMSMMTTTTLGTVFPDIVEEYGKDKKLDIVLSPSHDLFLDGVPDAKPTGVYMDKNGNWKIQFNLPFQVNIETFGNWEPIRNVYVTLVAKAKLTTNSTESGKVLNFSPKAVTITQLVIKKGEEEMSMEQMLIESMLNIQLDTLKKMFKNIPIKIDKALARMPPQLQCFGIKISDIDFSFKKSQL